MQIDWWTLLFQAINFLILAWLLSRLLYKPVRKVIEQRKAETERAFTEAAAREASADAARKDFEAKKADLAAERADAIEKARAAAEAEARATIDAAKAEAGRLLDEARKSIAGERDAAREALRAEMAGFAAEAAARMLKDAGAAFPAGKLIEQLDARLAALAPEERERLAQDLAADGGGLSVVTAAELGADEQARWTERLAARLDTSRHPAFRVDPGILGGAELHFPHAVLKITWADALGRMRKNLASPDADAS